jgi:hypothetical protein
MMPLQAVVVHENLARRQQECRPPQRARAAILRQQQRRETDSIRAKTPSQQPINPKSWCVSEFLRPHQNVLALWLEPLDLGEHPIRQRPIASRERYHDRFRIFAKSAE